MAVYDLVVLGATGFVGKLVVRYLLTHPDKRSFAIAGRSRSRLDALKAEFSLGDDIGIIEVNTRDPASLASLVDQSRVIINLAGPYHAYGAADVIKACAESERGVGYVDLTGESFFYKAILKYHDTAKKNGSIIIPSAGFDSVPFDLSVYLGVQALKKALGGAPTPSCLEATMAWKARGGISKGTILSLADISELAPQTLPPHPADLLSPIKGGKSSNPIGKLAHPALGKGAGMASPFLPHNGRIILRSAALLERDDASYTNTARTNCAYGKAAKFVYRESISVPFTVLAYLASFFLQFSVLLLRLRVGRWVVRNLIPDHFGPSERAMAKGGFSGLTLVRAQPSKSAAPDSDTAGAGKAVLQKMSFRGDPGYLQTAKMIVEIACVVADKARLPAEERRGGVTTVAALDGEAVAERFVRYAGFEISSQEV